MAEKIVQTAGKNQLGDFAPEFAHYNDDVLFGENWNNQDIDLKTRCIITIVSMMGAGSIDSSMKYHMMNAKAHGVTKKEIAAIITHGAFYVGWPKGWAMFNMAKEVWTEEAVDDAKAAHQASMIFPIGAPNDAFAEYFIGQSVIRIFQYSKRCSDSRCFHLCTVYFCNDLCILLRHFLSICYLI